jgi:hypothetical protein
MRPSRIFGVALLLSGCAGTASDRAARIVDPTPASRAALHAAVGAALGGADVTLAADALTQTSRLTIEHVVRRDDRGNPIMGRDLSQPIVFDLVRRGERCVLVRASDGARWPLTDTRCEYL